MGLYYPEGTSSVLYTRVRGHVRGWGPVANVRQTLRSPGHRLELVNKHGGPSGWQTEAGRASVFRYPGRIVPSFSVSRASGGSTLAVPLSIVCYGFC